MSSQTGWFRDKKSIFIDAKVHETLRGIKLAPQQSFNEVLRNLLIKHGYMSTKK